MRAHSRSRRSGITLVEAVIGVSLLVITAGLVLRFARTASRAYGTLQRGEEVNQLAWQTLERIAERLRNASWDNIEPVDTEAPSPSDWLKYAQCVGFEADAPVWGNDERVAFEYSPADPNDGIDNDGNGLVDEGSIVVIRNFGLADERRTVLCPWVAESLEGEVAGNGADDNGNGLTDEGGFAVYFEEDRLVMWLTVSRPDPEGHVMSRTLSRTVAVRLGNRDTTGGATQ